jgi:hypothetical protein
LAALQESVTTGTVGGELSRVSGLQTGQFDRGTTRDSAVIGGRYRSIGDATRLNLPGTTSFSSLPAAASLNAYFGERYSAGPGSNIQIQDMSSSEQRLGMEPLDPSGDLDPIDVTALAAAKGLGYLQESTWQRPERKLPPMPQSVFDGIFKSTTDIARNLSRQSSNEDDDDDLNDDDPLPL